MFRMFSPDTSNRKP